MTTAWDYAGVIAEFLIVICFFTSVSDMMMNGARDAAWAPWGMGILILCLIFLWSIGW